MNITTAFNLFMRAVLRTRELPFPITDVETSTQTIIKSRKKLRDAFRTAQEQSVINGTDKMTMEEIDTVIAAGSTEK